MRLRKQSLLKAFAILIIYFSMITDYSLLGQEFQIPQLNDTTETMSRPVTIMDIISLRNIGEMGGSGLSVSPDGKNLAFEAHQADVKNNTYRVAWFITPTQKGHPVVNVGDAGDPTLFMNAQGAWNSQKPKWSPMSEAIAYLKKENGSIQIWRSYLDGTPPEKLTNNKANIESFVWSKDGRKIFFITDAPREVIINAEKREWEKGYLVDDNEFNGFYSVKPIKPPYRLINGTPRICIYDLEKDIEREANPEEEKEYEVLILMDTLSAHPLAKSISFSPSGKRVAWLENTQPENYKGFHAPLTIFVGSAPDGSDSKACVVTEGTGRINGPWWYGEDEIVFASIESGGLWTLYAWSHQADTIRQIYKTYDWVSDCTVVDDKVICFREGPTTPRKIVSIDIVNSNVSILVDPNPEWRDIKLGEVERLMWENKFGRNMWGYFVKPLNYEKGKRYPLVIIQYDARSCLRGGTGDEFPTHVFAANDIAVLCISGTGGDPEIYKKIADPLAVFRAEYENFSKHRQALSLIEAAIELLYERGIIDKERVGITGLSAGVETLQYALIHSKTFSAASTSGGGMEPMSYYGSTKNSREQIFEPIGLGDFMQGKGESWRDISLSLNVGKIEVPLLIQAADREYLHAMQTVVTWMAAGKPIEMFVFPDEHHVKWHPIHRLNAYARNVDWFKFWLKGEEDFDPAKEEQYKRWRNLREQYKAVINEKNNEN